MTSRHAEIRVWTAYRDELTSWLCLLDDRYATELQETMSSSVEVLQVKLEAGKAARSTKLWFLLRQSMSKFQRGQDLVHLIEVKQMGASAGYELWRSLNNELSVCSRVEGQALREQALGLVPPKHLKRPLDVARWYTTELLKFEAQVKHRFPELLIGEQEGVLCLMKHLDSETKRYLLLHHSTKSMGELMTGLQFYDEQLRVMDFQREGASGYANAFKGGKGGKGDRDKSNKGSKGNKGNKGEKGEKGLKGGKAKGKDRKGDRSGKGDRARSKSREAKKTDVCRNCGKTGHWARDCWAPSKDKAAAATSQAVTTQPEAPSSSSSTSAKAAAQPTTKGSGKAQSSIKTFLEGYHFGMMLTNQVVSFPSDDRIYWLIDSGSSFHIITRETLESDHVKILSWLEGRPKSYAETATGDSVEIGGSTHVLVEVCFETTAPASSKSSSERKSDAVYMCKARFEAVISDQIKHNLLNINLLCQNGGWEPTLCVQQGGITVRKHGVTLKPTLFASVSWLASVRSDHPLALKPQDLIAKTEQHRQNRSRKSSADCDFHRSTSNRSYRNSARVCVEPENPELLDISCLDEMSDCKGHVSHEHADLDQGETKEKLRAVDELLGAAPSSFESVSHAGKPVFHELDSHTCLFSCADDNIISHGEQNNNTTPAVEWLVHACDSSTTAAYFPLSCFGRDLQEQSPKYRPESLGCPKHQEPPSFVVDALAHHGKGANGGGTSHERDNGPLYQRAGGYARGSASAQDATRGRAPGEQNHRGRGATRSPTRRGDFTGHDLRPITPAIRRGDGGRSRRCDNDGATIIPSSQSAHDGGAAVLPQGHSAHADAANTQDIEEERGPEEGRGDLDGREEDLGGKIRRLRDKWQRPRGLATLHGSEGSQERYIEAQEGEAGRGAEAYGGKARRSGTEWATSGLPHRTDPERQASLHELRLADLDMSPLRRVLADARQQRDRRPLLHGVSETSSRVPPDVGAAYRELEELHGESTIRTGDSPAGPCRLEHLEASDERAIGARDWSSPRERIRNPRPRTGQLHGNRDRTGTSDPGDCDRGGGQNFLQRPRQRVQRSRCRIPTRTTGGIGDQQRLDQRHRMPPAGRAFRNLQPASNVAATSHGTDCGQRHNHGAHKRPDSTAWTQRTEGNSTVEGEPFLQRIPSGLTEENPTALDPPRDSAQLPLSLEGPEADLRSTVRRVAAQGPPPTTSAATTARGHHQLSLRMELEHGLLTGAAYEERRRARSRGILNARARTGDSQGPSDSPTATACAEIDNGGGDTHHPSSRRGDHGSTHGATNDDGTTNGEFTGQGHNGHTASHGSTVRFYRDGQGSIIRFHRNGSTPPRVQSQARESIANPLRGKDPFVNALPESEKEEPNRYHIMLEEDVVGDTVRNRQAELPKALDGFVPPPEAPKTKELFLPYVPGGGPPIDWVRQHGVTPKCPGCQEGVSSSRHSQKCVKRYQKWLRDSIDDALEALDEGPRVDRRPEELIGEDPYDDDEQMKPNKRTRFGGERRSERLILSKQESET